jgi:hypothetical protein
MCDWNGNPTIKPKSFYNYAESFLTMIIPYFEFIIQFNGFDFEINPTTKTNRKL